MLAKISIILNVLSLVLIIIAAIIPNWYYWSKSVDGLTAVIKFGLWEWCKEIPLLDSGCSRLEELVHPVSAQIKAARAMVLMSMFPTVMAAVWAFLNTVRKREGRLLLVAAGISSGVAGFFCMIGAVLFVIENQIKNLMEESNKQTDFKPHASFALCITSCLLNLTGALSYVVDAFCTNRNRVTHF